MNILYKLIFFSLVLVNIGCNSTDSSSTPSNQVMLVPLGEAVVGLRLEGPLSGKKAYKLDKRINLPNCWNDSVIWTGSDLYFGLSSASFTKLIAGQGLINDPTCLLPRAQVNNDYFDIYKAKIVNGQWQSTYQNIDPINTEAGVSVSGSIMAYTLYDPNGNWDIYMT
ncbi:hypothetical protein JHD50_13520, partial [Sulfurimonas sp. MAG313]